MFLPNLSLSQADLIHYYLLLISHFFNLGVGGYVAIKHCALIVTKYEKLLTVQFLIIEVPYYAVLRAKRALRSIISAMTCGFLPLSSRWKEFKRWLSERLRSVLLSFLSLGRGRWRGRRGRGRGRGKRRGG